MPIAYKNAIGKMTDEAKMASVPLTIVQTLTSGNSNATGGGLVGGGLAAAKIDPDKQINDISFLGLMKKIKITGDDKSLDGVFASMGSPGILAPDNTLPPAGMILPLTLSQGALPGQIDSSILDNGPGQDGIRAQSGKNGSANDINTINEAFLNASSVKEKLPALVQDAQTTAVEKRDETVAKSAAGEPSYISGNIDLNSKITELPKDQNYTLSLVNNLSPDLLTKHAENIDLSHGTLAAASTLPQGIDKVNQNSVAPSITVSPKNPGWGDELGNRIMWMIHQDVQSASIRLNPPHLGPLEVNVSLANNQVDVSFSSHHASVKEALDASIPKLREMLGDNGLQLGDANVTHRSFSDQQQSNNQSMNYQYEQDGEHASNAINASSMSEMNVGTVDTPGDGMIDLFA